MNILKTTLLAASAVLALGTVAHAEDGPVLSANIGAASDYVFRGVSQTSENAQVFGGVDVGYQNAYAGLWVSNVDFGDSTDVEYDVYAGVKPEFAGINFDLGVVYYAYVNSPDGAKYGYGEVKALASRAIGKATVGAGLYYSPDFFGGDKEAVYAELNGAYAINDKVSITGAVGNQALDVSEDYTTWNIGAAVSVMPHVSLDLRYSDTDADYLGDIAKGRFAATIKASF